MASSIITIDIDEDRSEIDNKHFASLMDAIADVVSDHLEKESNPYTIKAQYAL